MLVGHIAIAVLEHHYLDVEFVPTMAGTFFPDVMDKALCHVLKLTPSGRMYAHTLLSVVVSTGIVRFVAGRETARAWIWGYVGHLLADSGGFIPILYPFRSYAFTPSPDLREILERFIENRREVIFEVILLVWALLVLQRKERQTVAS